MTSSQMFLSSPSWLDAVVRPTMESTSLALVISTKPPIAGPVAVAPPPMRMRAPAASRKRRRDGLAFVPVAGLISDSCGRGYFSRLQQLVKGVGGEGRLNLHIDRSLGCGSSHIGSGVKRLAL